MPMSNLWKSSLLWRLLSLLHVSAGESFPGRIFARLGSIWKYSGTRVRFVRFFDFLTACPNTSHLHRRLCRWNQLCMQKGRKLVLFLQNSLLYRLYALLFQWGRSSVSFGWLFRRGLTGILLLVLGLYVVIDYGLRDVLSISAVASVWDEGLLLLSLLWILYKRMANQHAYETRLNSLDLHIAAFLVAGFALMMVVCPFFSIALSGYRATVQYILWFYVVSRLLRSDQDFMSLYLTLIAVAFVISLHGIYQYIVAAPIPSHWTDQAEASVRTRVYSIFGSPNIMADFMVMFAPMTAALAYCTKNRSVQIVIWFCTFCMCFSCLFTMSRGGWMAMAVAVLVFAVLVDRRLLLLMAVAGICAMFMPFVASRIGYLFTDDFAASTANGGRASRWALALSYLETNPFWGFGLGMFGGAVAMQHKIYRWISYFYVDNYYLKILVEMGYFGFTVYILMLLGLGINSAAALYRTHRDSRNSFYPLCAGMVSGLCGVLVHCYFENIFEEPYMMAYFWMIAALILYAGFFRNLKKT